MTFCFHPALRCPLDTLALEMSGDALRCANNHSFDISRQGYANLLGAQDKRSVDPGDSKAMVGARHRFLEAHYYQPVADGLGALLLPHLQRNALVVDAGCGEGYYLQQLRERVLDSGLPELSIVAFDISKWAMQTAARRFPATWLVASNRNIPMADSSADVVLDMFGFSPNIEAFARVLKPSGLLVRVRGGESHLLELRELIYPQIKPRDEAVAPIGFSPIHKADVAYEIPCLAQAAIGELMLMTPHFFRASTEGKARVAALRELTLTVDVSIEVFQKA